MNYGKIYYDDIANGVGVRTALFVSGCTHHCNGCFNEVTWDFNYGEPFTEEVEEKILESLKPDYISGLSILGGEPMEIRNQVVLRPFIEKMKRLIPQKTIWIYSGYLWEELIDPNNVRCHCDDTERILRNIDILVDGEFILEKKDITLRFRGSSNQRIIDVQKSLEKGNVIISPFMEMKWRKLINA